MLKFIRTSACATIFTANQVKNIFRHLQRILETFSNQLFLFVEEASAPQTAAAVPAPEASTSADAVATSEAAGGQEGHSHQEEAGAAASHPHQQQQQQQPPVVRSPCISNKSSEDLLDQDSAYSLSHKSSICSTDASNSSCKTGRTPSDFTFSVAGATVSENESFSLPSLEHDDLALNKSSPSFKASPTSQTSLPSSANSNNRDQQQQPQTSNSSTAKLSSSSPQPPMIMGELSRVAPFGGSGRCRAEGSSAGGVEAVVKRIEMEVGRMEEEEAAQEESMEVDRLVVQDEVVEVKQKEEEEINDNIPAEVVEDTVVDDAAVEQLPQKDDTDALMECDGVQDSEQALDAEGGDKVRDVEMSAPIMYEARASSTHIVRQIVDIAGDDDGGVDKVQETSEPSSSPPRSVLVGPQPYARPRSRDSESRISPVRTSFVQEEEEREDEVELRPKKDYEVAPSPPVPKPRSILGLSASSNPDKEEEPEAEKSELAAEEEEEAKHSSLPPMEVSIPQPPPAASDRVAEKRLTFSVSSTSPKRAKCGGDADSDRLGARQLRGGLKLSSTTSLHVLIQPDEKIDRKEGEEVGKYQKKEVNSWHFFSSLCKFLVGRRRRPASPDPAPQLYPQRPLRRRV